MCIRDRYQRRVHGDIQTYALNAETPESRDWYVMIGGPNFPHLIQDYFIVVFMYSFADGIITSMNNVREYLSETPDYVDFKDFSDLRGLYFNLDPGAVEGTVKRRNKPVTIITRSIKPEDLKIPVFRKDCPKIIFTTKETEQTLNSTEGVPEYLTANKIEVVGAEDVNINTAVTYLNKVKGIQQIYTEAGNTLTRPWYEEPKTPDEPRIDLLVLSVYVGKVSSEVVGKKFSHFEELCKHFELIHTAYLKVSNGYWKFLTFKKGYTPAGERLVQRILDPIEENSPKA
eukprot:TRINITY_DN4271_c0_g2_i6.p1 TRINITY_DN4271_c0_g2~~TRINITY_DN4271_c0_g2_i6.p1  ORF type:complete len:286 (+),score=67.22 TRINITY_DN4271_c0_g2_i6:65-922(+)